MTKQIFEDCKRVEIEDDGNRAYKTINIIRKHGISVKIDISYARLKGSWNVIQGNLVVCPFCGATPHKEYKEFCPKCGADMRGDIYGKIRLDT